MSNWTGSAWTRALHELYLYDGWNLLGALNGTNNAIVKSFLWGLDLSGNLQGAGGVGALLFFTQHSTSPPSTHCAAYDGNGNVMALVDGSTGTASARYEYGPFGQTIRASGTAAALNPVRFSSKPVDDETDLAYYGYRYLNPGSGTWLSRDQLEERGGINLLVFVGNNPINLVDSLGLVGHCSDPCGEAKKQGLDKGNAGGLICCQGWKYACVWRPGNATNANAVAIVTRCITEHENDHVDDIDCPRIWCYGFPTRPPFKDGKNPNAEECSAYAIELNCLQTGLILCGGDLQCTDEVEAEMNFVIGERARRNCPP